MKKNILLILLSAALMTGCNVDLGFIKIGGGKTSELTTEEKQDQNNENSQEKPQENQNTDGNKPEDQSQNQDPPKPALEGEYTVEILFTGSAFKAIFPKDGNNIDNKEHAENKKKLFDYCSSYLEKDGLLESFSCTKLNTAIYGSSTILTIGTGYYAKDMFNPGTLTWNSKVSIYKVEIKAQAYFKENSYSGNVIDYPAHVLIDTDDHSLEVESESELALQTFSKEYAEGTKSFSINSTGGRVLLESLKITWRA